MKRCAGNTENKSATRHHERKLTMEPITTIEGTKGLKACIYQDTDPENPRLDYDHAGTIIGADQHYHGQTVPTDKGFYPFCKDEVFGFIMDHILSKEAIAHAEDLEESESWDERDGFIEDEANREAVILGITQSEDGSLFSDSDWRNGYFDGIAFMTKAKVISEYGEWSEETRSKAKSLLEAEVTELGSWCAGEVYGYRIEDEAGNDLDSCWGFYGLEHAEQEAKEALDYCESERPEYQTEIHSAVDKISNLDSESIRESLEALHDENPSDYRVIVDWLFNI
jgi:hypothetical protein